MSSYDALAASYDELMADVEYRRRADALARQFRRSPIPVETVLDLACGTGTIACLLAARGYRVIAVDGSEEMLTQAARKAAALERPPLFLHQSMPGLRLGVPVDAAVSTVDVAVLVGDGHALERAMLGQRHRRQGREDVVNPGHVLGEAAQFDVVARCGAVIDTDQVGVLVDRDADPAEAGHA